MSIFLTKILTFYRANIKLKLRGDFLEKHIVGKNLFRLYITN